MHCVLRKQLLGHNGGGLGKVLHWQRWAPGTKGLFHLQLWGVLQPVHRQGISQVWFFKYTLLRVHAYIHTDMHKFKILIDKESKHFQRWFWAQYKGVQQRCRRYLYSRKGIYRTVRCLISSYLSLFSHLKGMMKSVNWPQCQGNGSCELKLRLFPVGSLSK